MRVVIIGGGSYSWTPTFMRDIFTTPALRGTTVVLHDIDEERMSLVYRLGQKMLADFALSFTLEQEASLEHALRGADVVILTITTGGLDAMANDLDIPLRYGIRQTVGDTTGPGGLSRALRNIPVVAAIGRRIVEICPHALVLNYTNPMSTLTRVLSLVGARVVGLCHEWHGVRDRLGHLFGVEPSKVWGRVAGINHLIWLTGLWVDGRDVWPEMPSLARRIIAGDVDLDPEDTSVFADRGRVKARLFEAYGALPAAGDRHVAEFFSQFLVAETGWGADYDLRLTTIDDRRVLERDARSLIEAALRGDLPLAPFMDERSGEAAAEIIEAQLTGRPYTGIMNLPNSGQIAGLPAGCIVETYGVIDVSGARPISFGPLPGGVHTIVERHVLNQELTVRAAMNNDRAAALQVLINDPLCARLSFEQTTSLLDELLQANTGYVTAERRMQQPLLDTNATS